LFNSLMIVIRLAFSSSAFLTLPYRSAST
jgi:hypothetical protein